MQMDMGMDIKQGDITAAPPQWSQSSIQSSLRAACVGLAPIFTCITKAVLQVVLLRTALTRAKIVPPPPPSAKTTGTPTQFVPTAKTPTKASSALKTVLQDTESQEYLITRANNVHQVDSLVRGISINANRGRTAPAVHIFLPMVLELRTVCALPARLEHFPLHLMYLLAKAGIFVQQVK